MGDERRDHSTQWVEATGGAAVTRWGYTCPLGCTAKVILIMAYHNEGANLNVEWYLDNGAGLARNITIAAALPTATLTYLYPVLVIPDSIILHQGWTLSLNAAVTGAHTISYRALIEVRRGEAT